MPYVKDCASESVQRLMVSFALNSNEHMSMTPISVLSAESRWLHPQRQVARVIADCFKEIPQVKSICVQFGSDCFTVWTLLDAYDPDAREKVYEKELKVCETLNVYDFDFRVTSCDLVSPGELIETGSIEIFKRA